MNNKGFTLIEVLVALFIMVIIGSVVYPTMSFMIGTADRNRKKSADYETARLVLGKMSDEISGAILAAKPRNQTRTRTNTNDDKTTLKFIGEDKEENGQPADRLYFTASIARWLNKDTKENEISEIEYTLVSELGLGSALVRRTDQAIDGEFLSDPLEFGEEITGLDFKFYTKDGDEKEEWNSDSEEENKLPAGVKITITFGDEETGMKTFSTIAGIPVDM